MVLSATLEPSGTKTPGRLELRVQADLCAPSAPWMEPFYCGALEWLSPEPERRLICFLLVSACPHQLVLWASSNGAQRASAPIVQDSATPPPGGPRRAHAVQDTCVQSLMLSTPRAPVSVQENNDCLYLLLSSSHLYFIDTVSVVVTLRCHLTSHPPTHTHLCIHCHTAFRCVSFVTGCWGRGGLLEWPLMAPATPPMAFFPPGI